MANYNTIKLPKTTPSVKRIRCTVILNEQHTMLPQQKELLESRYENIDLLQVPAEGWTAKEQERQYMLLREGKPLMPDCGDIIFLSPLPIMLAAAAFQRGYHCGYNDWAEQDSQGCKYTSYTPRVYLFHNDKRTKQEKDGKVWYTVPQDGWILQYISAPRYY